jgi:HEAT repeat protein
MGERCSSPIPMEHSRRAPRWRHRRFLIWGIAIAVFVGFAAGAFLLQRPPPEHDAVREVHRYLSAIRRVDRMENGWLGDLTEQLMLWPAPFSSIAEHLLVGDPSLHRYAGDFEERLVGYGSVVTPILGKALTRDRSAAVRRAAATLLGQIASPLAAEFLMTAWTREQDEDVREAILDGLVEMDSVRALPLVLAALESDTSSSVRAAAAWALNGLQDPRIAPALISALDRETDQRVLYPILLTMGASGEPAVAPLLSQALRERAEPDLRRAAAEGLAGLGLQEAVPALAVALGSDPDPEVRQAAARALRQYDGPEVLSSLLAVLDQEESPAVQHEVLENLEDRRYPELGELLVPWIDRPGLAPEVRIRVALSLGRLQEKSALPGLVGWLHTDPDALVQAAAARAIASMGGPAAFAALGARWQQLPSVPPRSGPLAAGSWRYRAGGRGSEALESPERELARALGRIGHDDAVPLLVARLQVPAPNWHREASALGLGASQSPAALAPLLNAMARDTDEAVRLTAVAALGSLRNPGAVPALAAVLQSNADDGMRDAAVRALGEIGDESAIDALLATLEASGGPTEPMVEAVARVGDRKAVPALLTLLSDPSDEIRAAAAHALAELEDPCALEPLLELLRNNRNSDVRESAALALGLIGDRSVVAALIEALHDTASSVRVEAAWALGHLRAAEAVDPLLEHVNGVDGSLRFAGILALAEIGDPRCLPGLKSLIDHPHIDTRLAANTALGFLGDPAAIPGLARQLRSRSLWHRFAAFAALASLDTDEARQVLHGQDERNPRLRRFRDTIGDSGLANGLIEILESETDTSQEGGFLNPHLWAARALLFVEEPYAAASLRALCKHEDQQIRFAARLALRRLGEVMISAQHSMEGADARELPAQAR